MKVASKYLKYSEESDISLKLILNECSCMEFVTGDEVGLWVEQFVEWQCPVSRGVEWSWRWQSSNPSDLVFHISLRPKNAFFFFMEKNIFG